MAAADPGGLVDGLNLYRYSRDNPVIYTDPRGTQSSGYDTWTMDNQIAFENALDYGTPIYQAGLPTDVESDLALAASNAIEFEADVITSKRARPPTPSEPASASPTPAPSESPPPEESLPEAAADVPEEPGLMEQAREYLRESPTAQFVIGLGAGGLAGATPGGFVVGVGGEATGISKDLPRAFRLGYGLGEAAWGVAQIIGGLGGEVGGGALALGGA